MTLPDEKKYMFAGLNWKDLDELKQDEKFVLLFPIGSTESHGPHCPIGTDSIIAESVSLLTAQKLDSMGYCAFVLPVLSYTVTECARNFPGTVSISEETETALIANVCLNLIAHGMTKICIVNNHGEPGNVRAIYEAVQQVRDQTGVDIIFPNKLRRKYVERLPEAFKKGGTHADRYETSLIMAIEPGLVNNERREKLDYLPINLADKLFKENLDEFKAMGMDQCYCGDPASASTREGEETLRVLVDINVEEIEAAFKGALKDEGRGLFGSRKSKE